MLTEETCLQNTAVNNDPVRIAKVKQRGTGDGVRGVPRESNGEAYCFCGTCCTSKILSSCQVQMPNPTRLVDVLKQLLSDTMG